MLLVTVKRASVGGGDTIDSHVRVVVGRQEQRTSIRKRAAQPRWDESLHFKGLLHELVDGALTCSLWESKMRDHKRGQTSVSLRSVLECATFPQRHPLAPWSPRVLLGLSSRRRVRRFVDSQDLDLQLSDGSSLQVGVRWVEQDISAGSPSAHSSSRRSSFGARPAPSSAIVQQLDELHRSPPSIPLKVWAQPSPQARLERCGHLILQSLPSGRRIQAQGGMQLLCKTMRKEQIRFAELVSAFMVECFQPHSAQHLPILRITHT